MLSASPAWASPSAASASARYSDATDGGLPAFLPDLMVSLRAISGMGTPFSRRAAAKVSMSSSMTFERPPWLPLAAAACWPSGSSRGCTRGRAGRPRPGRRTASRPSRWGRRAGQRARQELQLDPGGLQGAGQGHQLGGVAGKPLHLVHGQDHGLARRDVLDVPAQPERLPELRPDPDAGGDLLGEDPGAPGLLQRGQLAGQLLPRGGAAGVPDPDGPARGGQLSSWTTWRRNAL